MAAQSKKAQNGKIEKKRLVFLVHEWNIKLTKKNLEFISMWANVNIDVNKILRFEVAGGQGLHYDIIILFKDMTIKTIEHKAIKTQNNDSEHPWSLTPQLLNAPYNFSEISLGYCRCWHSCMVVLKSYWPTLLPEIPDYNDWLKNDANAYGDPKSEWGIALKAIRKADKENSAIIDQIYHHSIKQYWKHIPKEKLKKFEKDLLSSIQHVLSQKHLWLNAFYETSSTIETNKYFLTITPQISNLSVHIHLNEDTDKLPKIELQYNLTSNPTKKFKGKALLRWGNGNGIANIRWNIS